MNKDTKTCSKNVLVLLEHTPQGTGEPTATTHIYTKYGVHTNSDAVRRWFGLSFSTNGILLLQLLEQNKKEKKKVQPRGDSNPESPVSETGALSIRPRGLRR